jgi:protein tyrosine phosphatase
VEALRAENKHLNRYRDVYPYNHSRVPLVEVANTD